MNVMTWLPYLRKLKRFESRREFLVRSLAIPVFAKAARTEPATQNDANRYRATPDGVIATESRIYGPTGLSFDRNDNLYVADTLHYRIRRIDAKTRIITTIAGTGVRGFEGDGGPATRAKIDSPKVVFVDRLGNIFFSEYFKDRVRRIDAHSGMITTVAGNGLGKWEDKGFDPGSKEGDIATRRGLDRPYGIGMDSLGNLILSDSFRVLKIDKNTQRMTTLLTSTLETGGFAFPSDLTVDHEDNIYFAEANTQRLRVFRSRQKTTETLYQSRDAIRNPVLDGGSNLFFILSNRIFRMELSSKKVASFANLDRRLVDTGPSGFAVDSLGNLYLSDWLGNRIRRLDRRTRIMEPIAGNGAPQHSQDYVHERY